MDTNGLHMDGGLEIEYALNAGGHGYSFVFPVNIWGATWWGKLMQKKPTPLWMNIYCTKGFDHFVILSGFSLENIP